MLGVLEVLRGSYRTTKGSKTGRTAVKDLLMLQL